VFDVVEVALGGLGESRVAGTAAASANSLRSSASACVRVSPTVVPDARRGPVPDTRPAPTVPLVDYRYRLVRVDADTADYEHMPDS
jgi:hypothetical protein